MLKYIIVFACVSVVLIAVIIFKPSIKIGRINFPLYWIPPFLGVVALLIAGGGNLKIITSALTADTAVNPLKILTLFVSMTVVSIYLDELGFFRYVAEKTAARSRGNQFAVFFTLCACIAVLTVFTSNDIIILTFTPFICYYAKRANVSAVPYLIMEFVTANTFSMLLIVGNPTNIYLSAASSIAFFDYTMLMALPTLFGGLTSTAVITLIFYKNLKQKMNVDVGVAPLRDKKAVAVSLSILLLCIAALAVSTYIDGVEMWYISLGFALITLIFAFLRSLILKQKPVEGVNTIKRVPYAVIPFVLSMFALVSLLDYGGLTAKIASVLSVGNPVINYGLASALCDNILNNIPMSVLFASVTEYAGAQNYLQAVLATVIGSNVGAFLTPIGALAGIMFCDITRASGVKLSAAQFIKYGIITVIPTALASLSGLMLSFAIAR